MESKNKVTDRRGFFKLLKAAGVGAAVAYGSYGLLEGGEAGPVVTASQIPAYKSWLVDGTKLYTLNASVGIGTTSPASNLDVAGNMRATGEVRAATIRADSMLCIGNDCRSAWPSGIQGSGTGGFVSKFITVTTVGNSLIYDDGSRIGIGTTTPQAKVHVAGGNLTVDNSVGIGTTSPAAPLDVTGNATFGSNVGIGTTNPATKVEVAGTMRSIGVGPTPTSGAGLELDFAGQGEIISYDRTAPGSFKDLVLLGQTIILKPTSIEALRVVAGGNVGIGTSMPSGRLHVSGGNTVFTSGLVGIGIPSPSALLHVVGGNTVLQGGNVGIGTTSPTNILTVQQGSATDPIADAWTVYSSVRWKESVGPITDALEKVQRLRGVYFDWKNTRKHDIGMIAEEVGQVIPEVVRYEENGSDAQSLDYARLTAVLVEAVKTLQVEIGLLEARIKQLEAVNQPEPQSSGLSSEMRGAAREISV